MTTKDLLISSTNIGIALLLRLINSIKNDKQVDPEHRILPKSGDLFVCDTNNHRIQKWTPSDNTGYTVAGGHNTGFNAKQLYHPYGIDLDDQANIYKLQLHPIIFYNP